MANTRRSGRAWFTGAGAVAAAAATLVLSSATVAEGADPAQVCSDGAGAQGSEYTQPANQKAIPGGQGTLYLYYDPATGINCAITMGAVSGSTYMDVGLRRHGAGQGYWDSGTFSDYAGPEYVSAKGICVDFTGAVGDRSATVTNTNCGE
ncbi:spore-associated protein [Streptomonospora wellingtoniae]|uniref:Spore-associated protein n=1 Tax=Streptomonospora wellingtoniae TaxID=3075544 RepID=A0ABU2KTB1_9ACTN|nr:spore-associated protein [Streptomonospora sp. DSM 45055]MDT0302502.1 spore-associated protein [Streptomonospora sp. DSM 45055]